jgi:hypothetical protein
MLQQCTLRKDDSLQCQPVNKQISSTSCNCTTKTHDKCNKYHSNLQPLDSPVRTQRFHLPRSHNTFIPTHTTQHTLQAKLQVPKPCSYLHACKVLVREGLPHSHKCLAGPAVRACHKEELVAAAVLRLHQTADVIAAGNCLLPTSCTQRHLIY